MINVNHSSEKCGQKHYIITTSSLYLLYIQTSSMNFRFIIKGQQNKGLKVQLSFLLLFLKMQFCLSQMYNLGSPSISNYKPEIYGASPQNWEVEITKSGLKAFANNDGILIFDNENWHLYKQPNKTITRSLGILDNEEILVGGQDEFGQLMGDKNGLIEYKSLLHTIAESHIDLEDIWQIEVVHDIYYVRTSHFVFKIEDGEFHIIHDNFNPTFLRQSNKSIFYNDEFGKIYKVEEGNNPELFASLPKGQTPIDLIITPQGIPLIFTLQHGIFQFKENKLQRWDSNANEFLTSRQIQKAIYTRNNQLVIGTRVGGVLILDPDGRCLYKLDKSNGLQNNGINDIKEDQNGDIWVAGYYGIDKILLSNNEAFFYPDNELQGAIYDIEMWNNKWWFGTANGLYSIDYREYYNPFGKIEFSLLEGTRGQVWGLDKIDDRLYLGHHNGAFEILKDESLTRIGSSNGIWNFTKLDDQHLLTGSYYGLYVYDNENAKWVNEIKLGDFKESSRIISRDKEGHIWVSHPYRGIYKIEFNSNYTDVTIHNFSTDSITAPKIENYTYDIFGSTYLVNNTGMYVYDGQQFKQESVLLPNLNDAGRIRKLFTKGENIWYITENECGAIMPQRSGMEMEYSFKRYTNLKGNFVGGFENLYPIDVLNQFICTNKGVLYHYANEDPELQNPEVHIASIKVSNKDSTIIGLLQSSQCIKLDHNDNNLSIELRSKGVNENNLAGYSFRLDGLDKEWSEYGKKAFKEYTNLKHGEYILEYRVKDNRGRESEVRNIEIIITPPWFLSKLAKLIYFFCTIGLLFLILSIPRNKYKKETEKLVGEKEEAEKEMEKIKKEKLRGELNYKNKELASATLHLVQKNQTINKVRSEINTLLTNINDKEITKKLKNMIKVLKTDMRIEEEWDRFSIHFDEVHNDFFNRLKSTFPELTHNDHELCAYLKMNLSTKEIAPLLGISIRGVEIRRYRLRKKLNLDTQINLSEFISNF